MQIGLLKELIDALEKFEGQSQSPKKHTIQEFVWWLNTLLAESTQKNNESNTVMDSTPYDDSNREIGKYIIYMSRYARFYSKQALENSMLATVDDFVYLAALLKFGSMTKTELIQYNIQEKAAGVEVIKRLLKNDFIGQTDHTTDRRSKLVSITEKGRQELFLVFDKMNKVSEVVGGNLTPHEKMLLLGLLKKLNDFHQPAFLEEKILDFK